MMISGCNPTRQVCTPAESLKFGPRTGLYYINP